ncbi:MAG: DUF4111 domain-containing protein [Ardenticatenaceae bacterium]|nr:DUF4111 domain-containing protein [Ardenticatenaceae bacterium]
MREQVHYTPFADINEVLAYFRDQLQTLLGDQFLGMVLVGSLALGDFDPARSDIDFIVVTKTELDEAVVHRLKALHEQFAASASPWAERLEVVYVPQVALGPQPPSTALYPQMERGMSLAMMALEPGWVFQCWSLRERGIAVAGPEPRLLAAPADRQAMALAVATIAREWLVAAQTDPSWLAWLVERPNHTFVVQTLCRLLYALATGEATSKPQAVRWAEQSLDPPWPALIQHMLASHQTPELLTPDEIEATVALLKFTLNQGEVAAS